MDAIKVISLFCGCGGADLGLVGGFQFLGNHYPSLAIEIAHASDIDSKCIATYNANFHYFRHSAQCLDVNDLSLKRGMADIVVGGFPCQEFSTVNPTKKPHSREKQLFWQMAKVVDKVRPKVLIAENVKGFYRLKGGKYFLLAKKEFERLGYQVYDKLLNASDYGIPQKRERLFMVGVRRSIKTPFVFPEPTHGSEEKSEERKVPLRAVIDDIIPPDPKYYFSKKAVEGVKRAKPNMKRALAQDLDDQCLTITRHLAKASLNSRDPVLLVNPDKELYRRFTPREAARIQSFPEGFVFAGSEGDAYRQIGNAVPPILMWRLARAVLGQIFKRRTPSSSETEEHKLIQKASRPSEAVMSLC